MKHLHRCKVVTSTLKSKSGYETKIDCGRVATCQRDGKYVCRRHAKGFDRWKRDRAQQRQDAKIACLVLQRAKKRERKRAARNKR